MIGNKRPNGKIHPGLQYFIIVLLVLGIFFRFTNLDKKVYWGDEVYTSLRIAGYTLTELVREVFDGQPKSIAQLQQYQRPHPEKNLTDTIKALAIEDAQHPPLYYAIAWFWERCFGSTVAIKRCLPALISLGVFPSIYYLSLELFELPIVGWVAVALAAVSPFHVLYAQEVREYSLWTVTILLSSLALLQARRANTKISWVVYALTLVGSLYTYLFSVLIAIAQAIYILTVENWRQSRIIKPYLLASGFAFLTFTPWLFFVITNLSTIQSTTGILQQQVALSSLVKIWGINLNRIFIDLNSQGTIDDAQWIIVITLAILVGYSIYYLCRHTSKQTWLFILTLTGVTGLTLLLPDLIFGGIRSSATRYLIPCYLGIQLAVAYTLAKNWQQQMWRLVIIALISAGVSSCTIASQAQSWWNKYGSYYNPQVARLINRSDRPLVIATAYVPRVLSLSYLLEPKTQIQFATEAISSVPDGFNEVFLYRPSQQLKSKLEKQLNYKVESIYQSPPIYEYLQPISQQAEIWLWRLVK